MFIT